MAPDFDTVAWFQIGTADPDAAQQFYAELFGWSATPEPGAGDHYRLVTYRDSAVPVGGIAREQPDSGYAAFCVLVRDVEATCARAVALGGTVLVPPTATPNGLVSADLADAEGNRFLVFTPPSG